MIGFGNFVNSVRINIVTMNKHELKSLLENIYEAMILPTLGQELYANPALFKPTTPTLPPNRVPPPPPPLKPIWPMTTGLDRLTKSMKRLRDAFPFPNSPPFQTEQADTMNKHELKSLLENIYTALTEEEIPDHPPAPEGYDSPDPWPWPPNKPPVVTPTLPPKPPTGLGLYPRPNWWNPNGPEGQWPPVNAPDDNWQTVPLPPGVQPPPGAVGGSFVVRTVQYINQDGLLVLHIEMYWIDKNGTMWHFNPDEGDNGTWEVIPPQGPPGLQPQQPDQPGEVG